MGPPQHWAASQSLRIQHTAFDAEMQNSAQYFGGPTLLLHERLLHDIIFAGHLHYICIPVSRVADLQAFRAKASIVYVSTSQ